MVNAKTRARIEWRLRRGMLELDALLHTFYNAQFDQLSEDEQQAFAELLEQEDPQLYRWFIGMEQLNEANHPLRDIVMRIAHFSAK